MLAYFLSEVLPFFNEPREGPLYSLIGLRGKDEKSFSLNKLDILLLSLLKLTLNPEAVVILILVDPEMTEETSALS
jgi:hypothetical protein